MQIYQAGGEGIMGITADGSVQVGQKDGGTAGSSYQWRTLPANALRLLDQDLTLWFVTTFPDIPRDDDGVFTLPICHETCFRVEDPIRNAKTARAHANCVSRTLRPWTRLHELEAHRVIKDV